MRHASSLFLSPFGLCGLLALLALAGCSSSGGGGEQDDFNCPEDVAPAGNSAFCDSAATDLNCSLVTASHQHQVCGVPLTAPQNELERSANVEKFAGSGPPDLSCFSTAGYPAPPGAPSMVTMTGVAEIFSHGCKSTDLTIQVWTVKRTGGSDDGDLDTLVGSSVTTPSDCTAESLATDDEDCGTRYECNYTYPGVPTETELLIKTDGDMWAPLYEYNIFIRNESAQNGMWTHNVRALAQDDYGVISQVALGAPLTAQRGAIAGEVHDCGDVRLVNAVVDVSVRKAVTTYFTNDEEHPLPELQARGTSTLGLYASMDINAGPVSIGAVGLVDDTVTTVGFFPARVFEDSVTSVTFRGLPPFLLQK
jgi:hypothetical protein